MTQAAIKERQEITLAPATAAVAMTPMEMLDRAVAQGASVETLEKLMALHERWETAQARKAFDEAMAAAKAEIPVIRKNRRVGYESKRTNDRTDYAHEDMAEIARTVDPILTKHGLSYRYRTKSEPGQPVHVTCIIAHRAGHSEETTLTGAADTSGSKNSIQAVGSTVTYLQRYTLKAALGLAAAADDDAQSPEPVETINQEQADTIRELLESTGKDRFKFLKWAKVERIEDLRADFYESAVNAIKAPARS